MTKWSKFWTEGKVPTMDELLDMWFDRPHLTWEMYGCGCQGIAEDAPGRCPFHGKIATNRHPLEDIVKPRRAPPEGTC